MSTNIQGIDAAAATEKSQTLHRKISWVGAFWVASGVPALVLFSIGAISATVGNLAWVVWVLSVLMGFIQSFTYAEIAGLFPGKSGGASVYGAAAWVRYSKLIAPISVWCNWFAWSPVLAIGSGLASGYILSAVFGPTSPVNTWQLTLVNLGFISDGLTLRINATFIVAAVLLVTVFAVQHRGILQSARTQMILSISALIPLVLIALVPFVNGSFDSVNLFPMLPLSSVTSSGNPIIGTWNMAGITVFAGGLFLAAWSTYGFETAVCYTREFINPRTDTYRAILYSGLLCIAVFTLVPFSFQGVLGLKGMLSPGIYSGFGVASAMAGMVHAGKIVSAIVVIMLVLALALSIMTAMAGSSRTLYQASTDGWLPKYLSHVNDHGAPTNAMWTDLVFNLFLLLMSNYVQLLALSNVAYIIFNFLNLNSGWIHRIDRPSWGRPFKAPTWLIAAGTILAFVNAGLLGAGADVWGKGTLLEGLVFALLIIPIFSFRHFVQDKGKFPKSMAEDLFIDGSSEANVNAGILPYLALAVGLGVVFLSYYFAVY